MFKRFTVLTMTTLALVGCGGGDYQPPGGVLTAQAQQQAYQCHQQALQMIGNDTSNLLIAGDMQDECLRAYGFTKGKPAALQPTPGPALGTPVSSGGYGIVARIYRLDGPMVATKTVNCFAADKARHCAAVAEQTNLALPAQMQQAHIPGIAKVSCEPMTTCSVQ